MLKRLVSSIRTNDFDKKEFLLYSQQVSLAKRREEASIRIQRAFRVKQQQKYQKMLLLKSSYVNSNSIRGLFQLLIFIGAEERTAQIKGIEPIN